MEFEAVYNVPDGGRLKVLGANFKLRAWDASGQSFGASYSRDG